MQSQQGVAFSADGQLVISGYGTDSSWNFSAGSALDLFTGGPAMSPRPRGGKSDTWVYQFHRGAFWLGLCTMHAWPFTEIFQEETAAAWLADVTCPLFYIVGEEGLEGRRLDSVLSAVGKRPVVLEAGYARPVRRLRPVRNVSLVGKETTTARRTHAFHPPLACTLGQDLHLFLPLPQSGKVLYAKTAAFKEPAPPAPPAEPGQFHAVVLDDLATTFALTGDGKHVLIAHEPSSRLSVLEVASGKVIKTLACPNPRHILCRGQKAYVANFGKGTITVVDCAGWKVLDQLTVGSPKVYYLSAPGGKFFAGKILATCGEEGTGRTYHWIDAAADKAEPAKPSSMNKNPPALSLTFSGEIRDATLFPHEARGIQRGNPRGNRVASLISRGHQRGQAAQQAVVRSRRGRLHAGQGARRHDRVGRRAADVDARQGRHRQARPEDPRRGRRRDVVPAPSTGGRAGRRGRRVCQQGRLRERRHAVGGRFAPGGGV